VEYLAAVWRRRWLVLSVFALVLAFAVFVTVRTKPSYQAYASLIIQPGNAATNFLASGNMQPTTANRSGAPPDVSDHISQLQSRGLSQRVAALLDSEARAAPSQVARSERQPNSAALGWYSTRFMQSGQTNIIRIMVTSPVPARATAVANAYAAAYREYNLEQNRADVTAVRQFVEDQLQVVGARLDSGERGLQAFKERHGMVEASAVTGALAGQQASLVAADEQSQIEIQGLEAELDHIRTRIAQDSPNVGARLNDISSPLVASLKANLDQLEVDKANLLIQGFSEQSARIQNLARQIADVRQQLVAESQKLVSQDNLLDPVSGMKSLYETQLTTESDLEAAQAREQILSAARERNETVLSRQPQAEREFARLSRDVDADRQIYSLLSQRYEEARIQEVARTSEVQIVDFAWGAAKVSPDTRKNLSFGFALGLALAFGVGLGVEYLDTSVHSPQDLERRGYVVLAGIPKLRIARRRKLFGRGRTAGVTHHLISLAKTDSPGVEAFRMLRTSLQFAELNKRLRTIVITSPGPSEGKSTVAVNLATILAQDGRRTLLLDADLRHPVLHRILRHAKEPGFTDMLLLGRSSTDAVFPTDVEKLFCLPCGRIPPSPADVLNSAATGELLQRLSREFEYVIIDTPPVLLAADSAIMAVRADTAVLVIRAGKTTAEGVGYASQVLAESGARVSGLVVNLARPPGRFGHDYYYHRYSSHYGYSHSHEEPADSTVKV
jgi:tyrosine-protein kinase Etk/Wzc